MTIVRVWIMSTFIMSMRSLSSELLSFLVAYVLGSTKHSKEPPVYLALLERVMTADLLLGRSNHTIYLTGPTHYCWLNDDLSFLSHCGTVWPGLVPYECKNSHVLHVVYLSKTDSRVKQGLTYIINISLKTRVMLQLFHS